MPDRRPAAALPGRSRARWVRAVMLAGALVLAGHAAARGATTRADVAVHWGWVDNLADAPLRAERDSSALTRIDTTVRRRLLHRERVLVDGMLAAGAQHQGGHPDLDRLDGGAAVHLQWLPWRGYAAPWIEASASLDGLYHRDSAIRDGARYGLGTALALRPTDRSVARLGWRVQVRRGDRGAVWDLTRHGIWARGELQVGTATRAFVEAEWLHGDFVASSSPTVAIIAAAATTAVDPAFSRARGLGPPGAPDDRVAYRLEGDGWVLRSGASMQLDGRTSVAVAAAYQRIDADGGIDYDGFEITATGVWRWR